MAGLSNLFFVGKITELTRAKSSYVVDAVNVAAPLK